MAFQDFDMISQRREQQRKQKLKRRLMIAGSSIFVILLIIGAAFGVMMYKNDQGTTEAPAADSGDKKAKASPSKSFNTAEKAVDTVCAATDYEKTCQSSLSKSVKSDSDNVPQDILTSSFSVVSAAIDKAADQAKSLNPTDPLKKAALEDCLELMDDAKADLNSSISAVKAKGVAKVSTIKPELENWLSAVVSYQQTCIDGFPDGEEKKTMQKNLKTAKELGSNALAIVSDALPLLTKLKTPSAAQRKLLGVDGLPAWMNQESRRRMLKDDAPKYTPNVTVAKDGSGKFKTINEALKAMPKSYKGRYVIYVKEGVYDESVTITRAMANVTIFGEGSQKSIVTGSKSFADGLTTLQTATFVVLGENFLAQSIGFQNKAGPDKKQAVALRVQGDRAMFINCRMEGYQAPLYAQTHRQFYRACYITGTVDIILGDAAAVFQNCNIYIRKGVEGQPNTVTAQGRVDKRETTGFVLHNSRILPDKDLESVKSKFKSYLGRPLQAYAKTIVMESEISDAIQGDGWLKGSGDYTKTVFFGEFKNEGAGADTSGRVKWGGYKGSMGKDEAMEYTVGPFLQGQTWIKNADVPVKFGMFH